jgi:hypothetical protein
MPTYTHLHRNYMYVEVANTAVASCQLVWSFGAEKKRCWHRRPSEQQRPSQPARDWPAMASSPGHGHEAELAIA